MSLPEIRRDVVYTGRYIRVAQDYVTRPDGSVVRRDAILHPGAVAVLPVLDDGRVCLIRNLRTAVGEYLLEIPAGTLEPGEAPGAAAVRELAEETGYRAATWQKLTEFFPSPGLLSERTHLYVARGLTGGEMDLEDDEDIEPCVLPWEQVRQGVHDGVIRDAKTIIAVLLWEGLRS